MRAREAQNYRARMLATLRAEVARFTTRAELIVTNARDPSSLHDALRKAFTISNQGIAKRRLVCFAKRGVMVYVHFGGPVSLPPEIRREDSRFPLLVKRRGFRIHCMHTTCPERARAISRRGSRLLERNDARSIVTAERRAAQHGRPGRKDARSCETH